MHKLTVDYLKNKKIVNTSSTRCNIDNPQDFIMALVSLCNELEVEIPIWTSVEERKLQKEKHVIIELADGEAIQVRI